MTSLRIAVVICSDRAAAGTREDSTAPRLRNCLEEAGHDLDQVQVVPDDRERIRAALCRLAESHDVVLTSGGTGLGPRDVTVAATREVLDQEIPGMAEAMRARSLHVTPMAMLSRAIAGSRGSCLIVNLPGSPKGAVECLEVVLPTFRHAHGVLHARVQDCQVEQAKERGE